MQFLKIPSNTLFLFLKNAKNKIKKGKIVYWGRNAQPGNSGISMVKDQEPMIVPGLENHKVIALATSSNCALFATEENKLFFIHTKTTKTEK